MLKGYLNCKDISKLLLGYIHFELNKKTMTRVAMHLRNCPVCMEKYTKIQKRKKELKQKMRKIENRLRMEMEISEYIDNEAGEDLIFNVEGMLLCDEEYKRTLIENEEIKRILKNGLIQITESKKPDNTIKIIAKMKAENRKKKKLSENITRLFAPLHHVFAKFV